MLVRGPTTLLALGALCLCLSVDAFPTTFDQVVFRHGGANYTIPAHVIAENADVPVKFDGHRVVTVKGGLEDLETVMEIIEELHLDLWSHLRPGSIDIRVPPSLFSTFTSMLPAHLAPSIKIPDLQQYLDSIPVFASDNSHNDDFFKAYHEYNEILEFTKALADKHDFVDLVTVGKTYEGKDIVGIKFTGGNGTEEFTRQKGKGRQQKKGVLFHGGQHAREWIGPATLTYLMHKLVTKYGEDDRITRAVDAFEWTLVPVFNIDGFVFTHKTNRMWRKNRQPTRIPLCTGTDTNRNWDYAFGKQGASGLPCSEAYHGPRAFSAPETRTLSDYISAQENLISYIDFHAFSQLWMFPFGQCDELPPTKDFEDLTDASERTTSALQSVHGTKFASGPICDTIYEASGAGVDWIYAKGGVKYSFAVELRDRGEYGFLLPPDQILPSGQEVLEAVLTLAEFIVEREGL